MILALAIAAIVLFVISLFLFSEKSGQDRKIRTLNFEIEKLTKELEYFESYSEFVDPLGLSKAEFDSERATKVFRKEN